jgi:hypothetical protein
MKQDNQRILNWLENEKRKDESEINSYKKKLISEIKDLNKTDLFSEKKKLSLWQKIKVMILGY